MLSKFDKKSIQKFIIFLNKTNWTRSLIKCFERGLLIIFLISSAHIWGKEESKDSLFLKNLIDKDCYQVTEVNKRACGLSNLILNTLATKNTDTKYVSISHNPKNQDSLEKIYSFAKKKGIEFYFWRINESYIEIEPTDMLIVHSLATYHHFNFILNTFSKNVRKYMCFKEMYKDDMQNDREKVYNGNYLEYPNPVKSEKRGVWQAVNEFLEEHTEWEILKEKTGNTLILCRTHNTPRELVLSTPVDYFLKNKIVLCTGPSLGRYQMLKDNLESELRLIPYKKIFVRTNDDAILNIQFLQKKPDCKKIPLIEKYVDCWNCIISSLKDAVNDPDIDDDDIILFKHESVFLNDLNLFKRAINKVLSGFDMIVRTYFSGSTSDIFIVKVSALKKIIKNYNLLDEIPYNHYVEMMLHTFIATKVKNVYCIPLGQPPVFSGNNTSTWGSNGLGFYHYHNYFSFSEENNEYYDIFGQKFWKKENYDSLYDGNYKIKDHPFYKTREEVPL